MIKNSKRLFSKDIFVKDIGADSISILLNVQFIIFNTFKFGGKNVTSSSSDFKIINFSTLDNFLTFFDK